MRARILSVSLLVIGSFVYDVPPAQAAVVDSQLDASAQATQPPLTDYWTTISSHNLVPNYLAIGYVPPRNLSFLGVRFRVNTSGGGNYHCPEGGLMEYYGTSPPAAWDRGVTRAGLVVATTTPDANGNCDYTTTDKWGTIAPVSVSPLSYYIFFMAVPTSSSYGLDNWVSMNGKPFASSTPISFFGYRPATSNYYVWGTSGLDAPYFELFDTAPPPTAPPSDPCVATNTCASNVLFLPGIEGSRLYEGTGCGKMAEEKLWEPANSLLDAYKGDTHVTELALDASGKSVCSDIYAKEGDLTSGIYASFVSEMKGLKQHGPINDWEPVTYDWRLSLNDLLIGGAQHGDKIYYNEATSTPYIEQTLRHLAETSKTGKVTLIAHSNGGLLAKALLNTLGAEATKLVDRVILVASPQSGAPADIGSLLVGYDAGIYRFGFRVVSNMAARTFAQNSPMAYHLLPSEDYLESTAPDLAHPVIKFSGTGYTKEEAAYGSTIANRAALDDFLLAKEGGRSVPAPSDLDSLAILNPSLIAYGNTVHDALDRWAPPPGIAVDQIGGWGVDTIAGIDFYTQQPTDVYTAFNPVRSYRPIITEDGDGTVTIPSAFEMATSTNVKRYWVDLQSYNKIKSIKRSHADLLEISQLQGLIKDLLTGSTTTLPSYVSMTQPPAVTGSKKLIFFLHSPLTLDLTDSSGNVTGINANNSITENIPGSTYGQFGEVKYVIVPEGNRYDLAMHGQANGTFSLDVQEIMDGTVTVSTTLADVPTTASTTVAMNVQSGISTLSPMRVDENGDGTIDATLVPRLGSTVFFDTTPPELQIGFSTTTQTLAVTGFDAGGIATITATTTYQTSGRNRKEKEKHDHAPAVTTVTASDEAGNTTKLIYTEQTSCGGEYDRVIPQALVYNGATTTVSSTILLYRWEIKKGRYQTLNSFLRTASSTLTAQFHAKKNATVILTQLPRAHADDNGDHGADERPTRQIFPGMVIPYVETNKGNITIGY